EVNVNGTFFVTQQAAKIMKKQKSGSIVNMASIYGMVGNDQSLYNKEANYDYYCFHKGGIINFTRYLAVRLGKYNIRANALSPGGIMWDKPGGGPAADKDFRKRYSKRTPLGRMAFPDEMNGALIYLLSDAASYVTGHNLIVDGGWTSW
ncbi:SDR family oxidoreductase, partial [Patescibacteria group bacterium]|nr:SDR family oxidoreductase [Patescibacteria group bacterium]